MGQFKSITFVQHYSIKINLFLEETGERVAGKRAGLEEIENNLMVHFSALFSNDNQV